MMIYAWNKKTTGYELNLIVGKANELRTIFVILIGEQKLL